MFFFFIGNIGKIIKNFRFLKLYARISNSRILVSYRSNNSYIIMENFQFQYSYIQISSLHIFKFLIFIFSGFQYLYFEDSRIRGFQGCKILRNIGSRIIGF